MSGESAFATYLPAIRARWRLVAIVTLAALAGGLAAMAVVTPKYESTAELVIAPLRVNDRTFVGLSLLRDTGDPARTAQTAARLVDSPAAAELTAQRLGTGWDAKRVEAAVRLGTQRQSNLLTVTARARSAELAARVANEFAGAALAVREHVVESDLRIAIRRLRARLDIERAAGGEGGRETIDRLAALQAAFDAKGDPTLALARSADVPSGRAGAAGWRIVLMALLAGLVVGAVGAVLTDSLDRRVRDHDDAVGAYPLPVLATVPRGSRRARTTSFLLTPATLNAFHTVRAQLQAVGPTRSILVASASSRDGRTTTAAGLAAAMVEAGQRVLLIDLDVGNPELPEVLGVETHAGLGDTMDTEPALGRLAVEAPGLPGLLVLPVMRGDRALFDELAGRLPSLIAEALDGMVDYVIVDGPPLGEVSDTLRLASAVDDVIVVVRPRHTDRARLRATRDLLERSEIYPAGLVVIGHDARSDVLPVPLPPPRDRLWVASSR